MGRKSGVNKPQTDDGRPYLKMKELVEASGTPWSTIQHYIKEGVLPAPLKTSPNMAYYHPDFVERLNIIKSLQAEHGFSLSVIKRLMQERDMGLDLGPLIELRKLLFTPAPSRRLPAREFLKITGLSRDELETCLELGLLAPLEPNRFDEEDVAAGIIYHQFAGLGLPLENLSFYRSMLTEVVVQEMRMRERLTEAMPYHEDAEVTAELTRGGRGILSYLHYRILGHQALNRDGLKDRPGKKSFKRI